MRIGLIASIWISVPPKDFGFGAQEYLAYELAEQLTKKGHSVTLFASADSQTSANLVSITDHQVKDIPTKDPKIKDIYELMNLSEAYKHAHEFDIFHNHLLPYGLFFKPLFKTPTVHTLHHQIYDYRPDYHAYKRYKNQSFVSISDKQRDIMPELNYIATVYNGIDTSYFTFEQNAKDYLLYIGRIRHYKGIHTAVALAKKLNKQLKIAAPFPEAAQPDYDETMSYWDTEVKPYLGNTIEYVGSVEGKEKVSLLQHAKALLFPVEREEPFGMTLIEAMSCGTPVIAYANGAIPEIVNDSKTGFLVGYKTPGDFTTKKIGAEGLAEAIESLYALPSDEYQGMRREARQRAQNRFTIETMVDSYEKVYEKMCKK